MQVSEATYREIFSNVLNIPLDEVTDKLEYESVPEWDSVGHMELVAALEDALGIMLDMDDIIDFSSYEKGREILSSTYGISFLG